MSHFVSKVTKSHQKIEHEWMCVCICICAHSQKKTSDKSVCHQDVWEGFWNAQSTKFTFRLSCTLMSEGQEVSMYYMSFKCLYAHLCPSYYTIPPLGSSWGWGILKQSGSEQCFSNYTAFESPGNRIKMHIQIPQCWDGALDPACLHSSQVRLILRGHVSSKSPEPRH